MKVELPGWTTSSTPVKLAASADQVPGGALWPKTRTAPIVTSIGVTKLTADASASRMCSSAVVKKTDDATQATPRQSCSQGRWVAISRRP